MIIENMTDLIGNTPMLKISSEITGLKNIDLYAKLEMLNPFGSVKDRTAWAMIKDDLAEIKAKNMTIYENSSGNTAKSLIAVAGMNGVKFRLVSALQKVEEQKQVMQILGAEIEEIAGASDCFDPSDNNDPQYLIERTARSRPGEVFFPSQFTNPKNPQYHHDTTAEEILDDLGSIDYFFGGVGTAGSSMGIIQRLRENNENLYACGVVSYANQMIPGIRNLAQMWESGIFKRDLYSGVVELSEQEAIDGLLTLCRRCGVFAGPSSGANYMAAIKHLRDIDATLTERHKAVFIVCDRMEWYISYLKERRPEIFSEPEKEHSLSRFVENPAVTNDIGISPEDLEKMLLSDMKPIVIDIRTAQSFQLVCIPGSMSMPLDIFRKWIDGQVPFEENAKIVLVCAVGEQSRYYANYLRSMNAQVYSLSGGIMSWRDFQGEKCLAA